MATRSETAAQKKYFLITTSLVSSHSCGFEQFCGGFLPHDCTTDKRILGAEPELRLLAQNQHGVVWKSRDQVGHRARLQACAIGCRLYRRCSPPCNERAR